MNGSMNIFWWERNIFWDFLKGEFGACFHLRHWPKSNLCLPIPASPTSFRRRQQNLDSEFPHRRLGPILFKFKYLL
jgi:hypothetical protein